ncbi:classical arabinogalactan protein 9-like [Herpailurus yagouaroundi]|uniref:classical arabinogalactan protein 9-like n=1 Tax=Herpailurus yagouaroundi TaxID=1608482 RepID=UPI001AD629D6|nr:classical arabinogalactan protein 9-like [Puma yagouaroundi]
MQGHESGSEHQPASPLKLTLPASWHPIPGQKPQRVRCIHGATPPAPPGQLFTMLASSPDLPTLVEPNQVPRSLRTVKVTAPELRGGGAWAPEVLPPGPAPPAPTGGHFRSRGVERGSRRGRPPVLGTSAPPAQIRGPDPTPRHPMSPNSETSTPAPGHPNPALSLESPLSSPLDPDWVLGGLASRLRLASPLQMTLLWAFVIFVPTQEQCQAVPNRSRLGLFMS